MPPPPRKPWSLWPTTAIALAAIGAIGYFLASRLGAGPALALKALAVWPLVGLALLGGFGRGDRLLGGALVLHAAGDLLIELAPLPAAMAAFGCGHVAYATLFARERRGWEETEGGAKLRLGILALLGAGMLAFVGPRLPPGLRVPVPLYALLLLLMAWFAQVSRRGVPWVAFGAFLYVLSDSLLASDLFGGPLPWTRWLVWPTYWGGQLAIVLGWLADATQRGPAKSDTFGPMAAGPSAPDPRP